MFGRDGHHDLLPSQERRKEGQDRVLGERAEIRRDVDPTWLQETFAPPERTLAYRIEDEVIGLWVLREIFRRAIDDPFGTQAEHKVRVLGIADSGDPRAKLPQDLDSRRADRSGCAVDEHALPALDLRLGDERERVVRTFGARGDLLVAHVRGDRGDRPSSRHRHVLGVRAEPELAEAEHAIADLEGCDSSADRLDLSGELGPQDGRLRPEEPAEEADDPWFGRSEAAVGAIDGRCVNADEHLVVPERGLVDLHDLDHVRRTVSRAHGGLHREIVST